ncbi:MAG TPA: hypothetical protein VMW61_03470 [Dehalococcoidales bacterium]|nr:hypothetical protein [Dehalococcoidales bacterium]
MQIVQFVPGAIVTPNPITLPASAPDIQAVVSAEIERLPAALADHAQAAIIAAVADHAAHGHDITTVGPAGGGGAVTAPAVAGPLESVGGPVTNTGAVDVLAAAQAHAAGAAAVAHAGGNPVVAAVPTRLTTRTFSLNVDTLVGDLLTLNYLEVGERVLVS